MPKVKAKVGFFVVPKTGSFQLGEIINLEFQLWVSISRSSGLEVKFVSNAVKNEAIRSFVHSLARPEA